MLCKIADLQYILKKKIYGFFFFVIKFQPYHDEILIINEYKISNIQYKFFRVEYFVCIYLESYLITFIYKVCVLINITYA